MEPLSLNFWAESQQGFLAIKRYISHAAVQRTSRLGERSQGGCTAAGCSALRWAAQSPPGELPLGRALELVAPQGSRWHPVPSMALSPTFLLLF